VDRDLYERAESADSDQEPVPPWEWRPKGPEPSAHVSQPAASGGTAVAGRFPVTGRFGTASTR
jgi:hypothetical protein